MSFINPKFFKNLSVWGWLEVVCIITYFAAIVSLPLAWLTHVIMSIMNEQWLLLIAGAIMFPIGILHGYGIWLGVW